MKTSDRTHPILIGHARARCAFLVLFGLIVGCASKPPHSVHYGITTWNDLTTQSVEPVADGYRRIANEETQGVFPASVAVCRVTRSDAAGEQPLTLAMKPSHDVLPWNGAFDPIRSVAEAFPLATLDLQGQAPTVDRMLNAAATLDSNLLLVYTTPVATSPTAAEVKGAIYDAHRGQMLAVVQSQVELAGQAEVERPAETIHGDESYLDPQYLAARKFEQHALACLLELRAHDHPAAASSTEGWQRPKDRPTVEWIQIP